MIRYETADSELMERLADATLPNPDELQESIKKIKANTYFTHLYASSHHFFLKDNHKRTWGINQKHNFLNFSNTLIENMNLNHLKINSISTNSTFSLAISDNNKIYAWGNLTSFKCEESHVTSKHPIDFHKKFLYNFQSINT